MPLDIHLESYRGRWIAVANGKVIAQGGTPQQAETAALIQRPKEKPAIMYIPTSQQLVFPEIVERLRILLSAEPEVYLVGGVVRDALRGTQSRDVDLVLPEKAIQTARRIANQLGGDFFTLKKEFDAGRVLLKSTTGEQIIIDFTSFRGQNLDEDLRARDFTINAIAVDLHDLQKVYDPLAGVRDVFNKQIRACSEDSILSDPIRILRAIRIAANLSFKIHPGTRTLLKSAAKLLPGTSSERQRDELFKILAGKQPATAIRALDLLGALGFVLPELVNLKGVPQSTPHVYDVYSHTLEVVTKLEQILEVLGPHHDPDGPANALIFGLMVLRLGRYRQQIDQHVGQYLTSESTLRPSLFLAALYHDIGKPVVLEKDKRGKTRFFKHDVVGADVTKQRAKALHLSNDETERIEIIVRHHMRPLMLTNSGQIPSKKAIYRFFRDTGQVGVDICLLSLADFLGTYGPSIPQDLWAAHLDTIRDLLSAWWENYDDDVNPGLLLNGNDLINRFGLTQGPLIGEILSQLQEAQAVGDVKTISDAEEFIQRILVKIK